MKPYEPSALQMVFSAPRSRALALFAVALGYVIAQIESLAPVAIHLDLMDNDDMLRLLSVRSLLAGQQWFDMTQYKLMPPEGLELHWSRYVDAGIAGLQLFLRLFLSREASEGISLLVWPSLLFVLFVLIAARSMAKTYSIQAANFTIMFIIATGVLPLNYFHVGRIDHHNVQLILMLVSTVLILYDHKPIQNGALSGAAAALSAAVGLETLPFYMTLFCILLVYSVIGLENSRQHLLGFGLGLGLAAPLFFMGQTHPNDWETNRCDALSLPILLLTTALFIFVIIVHAGLKRNLRRFYNVLLVGGVGSLFLILLWPHLETCMNGPYANLPKELRLLISTSITEAQPVTAQPAYVLGFLMPTVLCILAAIFILGRQAEEYFTFSQRKGAWLLVFLSGAMTLGMFFQMRFVVSALSMTPLLFGFSVYGLLSAPQDRLSATRTIILSILVSLIFLTMPLSGAANTLFDNNWNVKNAHYFESHEDDGADADDSKLAYRDCKQSSVLKDLNILPPGRILSEMNLGPPIALHTWHFALSAPYHRNYEAMNNGLWLVFQSEEKFFEAVEPNSFDYIVVCKNSDYAPDIILSKVASGNTRSFTEAVQLKGSPLRVFRLD